MHCGFPDWETCFLDGAIYHLKDTTVWPDENVPHSRFSRNSRNYSRFEAKFITAANILSEGRHFLRGGRSLGFPYAISNLSVLTQHLSLFS